MASFSPALQRSQFPVSAFSEASTARVAMLYILTIGLTYLGLGITFEGQQVLHHFTSTSPKIGQARCNIKAWNQARDHIRKAVGVAPRRFYWQAFPKIAQRALEREG